MAHRSLSRSRDASRGLRKSQPGGARIGVMALELPPAKPDAKKAQPTVLQIVFPVDRSGNLTATLVL